MLLRKTVPLIGGTVFLFSNCTDRAKEVCREVIVPGQAENIYGCRFREHAGTKESKRDKDGIKIHILDEYTNILNINNADRKIY